MKTIQVIGTNRPAVVDDIDFERISKYDWYLLDGCAVTKIKGRLIEMGALVLVPELAELGPVITRIDGEHANRQGGVQ